MTWRDKNWKYTPSSGMDESYLRRKFAAIERRLKEESKAAAERDRAVTEEREVKVTQMRSKA